MMRAAACLLGVCFGAPAPACLVTDYGARPNDARDDTRALQRAIDDCAAAGGGRVIVPAGRFEFGTLQLRSRIELHLSPGAVLRAHGRFDGHPRLDVQRGPGDHGSDEGDRRALIFAHRADDVAITGSGLIDGNGPAYWEPGFIGSGRARPQNPRPRYGLWFLQCSRVNLLHFRMIDPPMYFITSERSEDVFIDGIRLDADPLSPNSDGIQIEGGSRIRIVNVSIRTGDDAIVLKTKGSGPIEDVSVIGSHLQSDDSAFKFGTGSELPVRRVLFADSIITRSRIGIAIFMKDGGLIEGFTARGIRIDTGSRHATDYPIYLDIDRRTGDSVLGRVRDVLLSDLDIRTRGNILINGHRERPFEDLTLRDIRLRIEAPVDLSTLRGKPRGNALVEPLENSVDYSRTSAHVTIAHVDGLAVDNVRLQGTPEDLARRAPGALIGVRNARVRESDLTASAGDGAQ